MLPNQSDQKPKPVTPKPFLGTIPKSLTAPATVSQAEESAPSLSPVLPLSEPATAESVAPSAVTMKGGEEVAEPSPPLVASAATETGEGGESGTTGAAAPELDVSNAEFLTAIFDAVPEGAVPIVCAKSGDPEQGGWFAQPGTTVEATCLPTQNTYFNCSSFCPDDTGNVTARKEQAAAFHVLVLDDVGTKVDRNRLEGFAVTWELETSPGNYQVGIKLAEPLRDPKQVDFLQRAIADAGLCDRGALGSARWARLPCGINGKKKYRDANGKPFVCKLHVWNPGLAQSAEEIIERLVPLAPANTLPALRPGKLLPITRDTGSSQLGLSHGIFTPRAPENPVITALRENKLYKRAASLGVHDITCPWVHEHTDQLDTGTAYFEPSDQYAIGGFCCQHSHRDQYHISHLIEHLGVTAQQARHKPLIRLEEGEGHRIVAASEQVLAELGDYYQSGGKIVRLGVDAVTGAVSLYRCRPSGLRTALSAAADWERFDRRSGKWVRCNPPMDQVNALFEAETYRYLRNLEGLAHQPFYREDGQLVATPGYDAVSMRFGAFDPAKYGSIGSTREAAEDALALLLGLLDEFPFASASDRAAAVSAIFTAVLRPALDLAPAYSVTAPSPGGGKSYLCELITLFASAGLTQRLSYPKREEEAGKVILSLLMTAPPVIEFDDMDSDWKAHSVINSLLTSQTVSDRKLGGNEMALVSTRTLVLGSGNNIEPARDLRRRIVSIRLDPACANPALRTFKGNPVGIMKADREKFVAAVLTIVEAWKAAGSPKTDLPALASYGGAWTHYCRHPLVWLGLSDPAEGLIEQIRHDPEADRHGLFLREWERVIGYAPLPVRALVSRFVDDEDLHEAALDLPVTEGRLVNRGKLGWYLTKNADRIVDGLTLRRVEQASRLAWRVERVGPPVSPLSPPSFAPHAEDGGDEDIGF